MWWLAGLVLSLAACGRVDFGPIASANDAPDARPDVPLGPSARHWVIREGGGAPGAITGPRLAFDPTRGQVVLFGGDASIGAPGAPNGKMFAWTGTTWTLVCSTCGPIGRLGHAMAYDPDHHVIWMFGGLLSTGDLNDLWSWDGTTWTMHTTVNVPSPRHDVHFVHDPVHHQMILFGGRVGTPATKQMFAFDGVGSWSTLPQAPDVLGGEGESAVWDPVGQRALYATGSPLGDVLWAFDGAWSNVCTSCTGTPRSDASLVADMSTVYLTGGYDGTDELAGTFRLEGSALVPHTAGPGSRDSVGAAYDPIRDVIVMYGGNGNSCTLSENCDETWEMVRD